MPKNSKIDQDQLRDWSREIFVLPASLSNGLGFIQNIAVFAVTILAVASMGVEYGWGTLRTALTRGTGRWQFLAAKALIARISGHSRAPVPVARADL